MFEVVVAEAVGYMVFRNLIEWFEDYNTSYVTHIILCVFIGVSLLFSIE